MNRRWFLRQGGLLALTLPVSIEFAHELASHADESRASAAQPQRFAPAVAAALERIVEVIIPTTDTPGAKEAGVVGFIELITFQWLAPQQKSWVLEGLAAFEREVEAGFGRPFAALSADERYRCLAALEEAADHSYVESEPLPFIALMKRLTIYGYYTSQIGSSVELTLNLVPGHYDPCARVIPAERAAALDRRSVPLDLT